MCTFIKDNATVLFQGDSVTDCGRSRENDNNLGVGYPNMVAAWFSAMYPEKNVKFFNRGISGNRVRDLKERWEKDCIDLKPDVVSILIGINDCWRRYDSNDPTSMEYYEANFRYILKETRDKLDAKLIICEPFVLPFPKDREAWREDLDPKIQAARRLAKEFDAIYIPFDGMYAEASMKNDASFWTADGVHPTQAGHAMMSIAWLKAIKAL